MEGQSAKAEGVSADYISHYNAMKAVIGNNANSAVKIFSRCFDFFLLGGQPAKNVLLSRIENRSARSNAKNNTVHY